jgi:hypothetical protein
MKNTSSVFPGRPGIVHGERHRILTFGVGAEAAGFAAIRSVKQLLPFSLLSPGRSYKSMPRMAAIKKSWRKAPSTEVGTGTCYQVLV